MIDGRTRRIRTSGSDAVTTLVIDNAEQRNALVGTERARSAPQVSASVREVGDDVADRRTALRVPHGVSERANATTLA
jgi:hypothetical protein